MASQDEAFDEVQQQQVDDEIIAALLAPSPSRDRARAGRVTDCTSEGSVFARLSCRDGCRRQQVDGGRPCSYEIAKLYGCDIDIPPREDRPEYRGISDSSLRAYERLKSEHAFDAFTDTPHKVDRAEAREAIAELIATMASLGDSVRRANAALKSLNAFASEQDAILESCEAAAIADIELDRSPTAREQPRCVGRPPS